MLNSVAPIIDGVVCVDTGSTDNSKEIIESFCKEKSKPLFMHDYTFTNFEDTRNFALSKLKDKCDYGFWIDCKEELRIDERFNIEAFKNLLKKFDFGFVGVANDSSFLRNSFFKVSLPLTWKGKVHEVLTYKEKSLNLIIKNLSVIVHKDGYSTLSQTVEQKYLSYAKILEDEVLLNNDPRDIFYLAQCYFLAKEYKKAIEWYEKRIERKDGFFEERYYSQFCIGNILKITGENTLAIKAWDKCTPLDSLRAEHFLNMGIELQNQGLWMESYDVSRFAYENFHGKNPFPQRHLCIDNDTYSHKLLQVHVKNCHHLGQLLEIEKMKEDFGLQRVQNA